MLTTALKYDSTDGRLPLYQRIRDVLANQIASGQWKPGTAITPEQVIATEFGVALGTVKRAIGALVDKGLLERRQGIGTFVRQADFTNSLFRYFELFHEDGTPILPEGRILERRVEKASGPIAEHLHLEPGDPIYRIHRLRGIAEKPLLVEEVWLPYEEFSALDSLQDHEWKKLLYRIYEQHCGRSVAHVKDHLSFGRATKEEADLLWLPADAPVLVIERCAVGFEGRPIEWRRSIGDAETLNFTVELN